MMKRGIIRSICSCNFIIFLLCLIEVSSAPAQQHESNILNSMREDKNLSCKLPWDHVKMCENVTYPTSSNIKLSVFKRDIFLCLGAYDAFYKVCNYSNRKLIEPADEIPKVKKTIDAFFAKEKNDQMESAVCKNLKGLTPSYEKTKPLFSVLMKGLNEPETCKLICFDMSGDNPDPLCAILEWSRKIDHLAEQNAKLSSNHTTVIETTDSQKPLDNTDHHDLNHQAHQEEQQHPQPQEHQQSQQPQQAQEQQQQAQHQQQLQQQQQSQQHLQPQQQHQPEQVQQQLQQQQIHQDHSQDLQSQKKQPTDRPDDNNAPNVEPEIPIKTKPKHVPVPNPDTSVDHPQIQVDTDSKPVERPNIETEQKPVADANDVSNNETPQNVASLKPDNKYTTISENTQEHDTGNVEDRNHSLEAQVMPDDLSEPPTDISTQSQYRPEPSEQKEPLSHYHSIRNDEDSHFFTYFTVISLLCIAGYVGYHNKQKVLAIVLEGRRSRSSRSRRRPSTASYRKLDCTLEEAVTSQCNANVTHVIY